MSGSVSNRPSSRPSLRWSCAVVIEVSLLVVEQVTGPTTKPRGTCPGASDQVVCQRAGTLSGVVVMAARFMSQTLAGRSDVHTLIPRQEPTALDSSGMKHLHNSFPDRSPVPMAYFCLIVPWLRR